MVEHRVQANKLIKEDTKKLYNQAKRNMEQGGRIIGAVPMHIKNQEGKRETMREHK